MIDVNENLAAPKFDQLVYNSTVSESALPGSTVLKVQARDSDIASSDSKVSYSIQRGSGLGRFTVDSSSGKADYKVYYIITLSSTLFSSGKTLSSSGANRMTEVHTIPL